MSHLHSGAVCSLAEWNTENYSRRSNTGELISLKSFMQNSNFTVLNAGDIKSQEFKIEPDFTGNIALQWSMQKQRLKKFIYKNI